MKRNLKVGAVLAAVLAMSVIGAVTAQAGQLKVGPASNGSTSAWLTGSQTAAKNKLTITSVSGVALTSVVCNVTNFDITVSGLSSTSAVSIEEVTTTPTISGCEIGGLAATVNISSCKYTLSGVGTAALTANVSLTACTSAITFTEGTCVLSIPSTSATLEKITYASVAGPPKSVLGTLALKKIPVTAGAGCPANLQAAGNTGDLSGAVSTKAFSDDGGGTEGTQINLEGA
jgi:hypothetical protein